ncbi:zinc finger protein 226 [Chrysoperla carnea]|uniref:zinc finger protein 226 n=1 Tax=Chrysoperla carnea TaxID=189513 RepID=UPI001D088617|nr:zinc finger protein 226 [Chrysoperla carnea]
MTNMEVDNTTKSNLKTNENKQLTETCVIEAEVNEIIKYITDNELVHFKSQQRNEEDISVDKKKEIALEILERSKSNFLSRFGKYCKVEHLDYFKQFCNDEKDGYEIQFYLNELSRYHDNNLRKKDIKNRRYQALLQMQTNSSYFSEVEMMKRNPLLYEQLVGQYLTEDERKIRDKMAPEDCSFVNILLEGYQKEQTQILKHKQEDFENEVMEEENDESDDEIVNDINSDDCTDFSRFDVYKTDESNKPSTSQRWGEWDNLEDRRQDEIANTIDTVKRDKNWFLINANEKRLLKQEFESYMYQSFLDGKDNEFDYSKIDNDTSYDNIDVKTIDDEEKYFDSETPEEIHEMDEDSTKINNIQENNSDSDDELDIFMKALNQHPTVCQLANDLKKYDTGEKDIACDEKFNDANKSTIVKNESVKDEQLHTELIIKDDDEEGTSESKILEENNSSDDEMEIFGQQTNILECGEKFNDANNSTVVKSESFKVEQLHTELIIKDDAEEGTSESEILEDSSDVGYENRVGDHTRENTAEEYFPCNICQKTFISEKILYAHQRLHTGEKPFSLY